MISRAFEPLLCGLAASFGLLRILEENTGFHAIPRTAFELNGGKLEFFYPSAHHLDRERLLKNGMAFFRKIKSVRSLVRHDRELVEFF